jgi:hypothetical protein
MSKPLPKTLYVSRVTEGDEEWLSTSVKLADAIDEDGPTMVGTYTLVEVTLLKKTVVPA